MCSTTAEPLLPSIKECTYLVARCTINMHTISDDANFSCAPGDCTSQSVHAMSSRVAKTPSLSVHEG